MACELCQAGLPWWDGSTGHAPACESERSHAGGTRVSLVARLVKVQEPGQHVTDWLPGNTNLELPADALDASEVGATTAPLCSLALFLEFSPFELQCIYGGCLGGLELLGDTLITQNGSVPL